MLCCGTTPAGRQLAPARVHAGGHGQVAAVTSRTVFQFIRHASLSEYGLRVSATRRALRGPQVDHDHQQRVRVQGRISARSADWNSLGGDSRGVSRAVRLALDFSTLSHWKAGHWCLKANNSSIMATSQFSRLVWLSEHGADVEWLMYKFNLVLTSRRAFSSVHPPRKECVRDSEGFRRLSPLQVHLLV